MPIIVNLDVMMAKRRMPSGELASKIGLSQANLSILKTGKAKAVRFSTLEAICKALECQPGDILEYDHTDVDIVEPKEIKEQNTYMELFNSWEEIIDGR